MQTLDCRSPLSCKSSGFQRKISFTMNRECYALLIYLPLYKYSITHTRNNIYCKELKKSKSRIILFTEEDTEEEVYSMNQTQAFHGARRF